MDHRSNTIFGWALLAGIVALGGSIVSGKVFHADSAELPEKGGYPVEGAAEGGGADEGPPLATLLAEGDAAAGEKVFAKCTSCHSINQGGANGIGPNLWGVLGKPVGQHAAGFAYSSALSGHGGNWDFENMDAWLKSPRAFASGTKMSFAGLSSPEDRANVILYMLANGGGPPLPAAPAEGAEAVEGDPAQGDNAAEGVDPAAGPTTKTGPAAAGATAAPDPTVDQGGIGGGEPTGT